MRSDVEGSKTPVESIDGERSAEATNDRRHVLKALGVAAAGLVAGGVLSTEEALAHGGFHQDSNSADPAIHGNNTNGGPGVQGTSATGAGTEGTSTTGPGVYGSSDSHNGVWGQSNSGSGVNGNSVSATGVHGESDSGTGVFARSQSGPGVVGESIAGAGVLASSDGAPGVQGRSHGAPGVLGRSDLGPGVHGEGNDTGPGVFGVSSDGAGIHGWGQTGPAVLAENNFEGDALQVKGPARFTTAGSGVIPAGQSSRFVSNPAVTPQSHITVTLTGNPGVPLSGFPIVIHWVQRQLGGFVIHMTRAVGPSTPFTYLIVEPG